jgi:hypothetical protein
MSEKVIVITFESMNKGNYTVVKNQDLAPINQQIKKNMDKVIIDFNKREQKAREKAALLVLNR